MIGERLYCGIDKKGKPNETTNNNTSDSATTNEPTNQTTRQQLQESKQPPKPTTISPLFGPIRSACISMRENGIGSQDNCQPSKHNKYSIQDPSTEIKSEKHSRFYNFFFERSRNRPVLFPFYDSFPLELYREPENSRYGLASPHKPFSLAVLDQNVQNSNGRPYQHHKQPRNNQTLVHTCTVFNHSIQLFLDLDQLCSMEQVEHNLRETVLVDLTSRNHSTHSVHSAIMIYHHSPNRARAKRAVGHSLFSPPEGFCTYFGCIILCTFAWTCPSIWIESILGPMRHEEYYYYTTKAAFFLPHSSFPTNYEPTTNVDQLLYR